MTKITKLLSLVTCSVFSVAFFTSVAYADVVLDSSVKAVDRPVMYWVVGGVILVVSAVSIVVLVKIRRKNAKLIL